MKKDSRLKFKNTTERLNLHDSITVSKEFKEEQKPYENNKFKNFKDIYE